MADDTKIVFNPSASRFFNRGSDFLEDTQAKFLSEFVGKSFSKEEYGKAILILRERLSQYILNDTEELVSLNSRLSGIKRESSRVRFALESDMEGRRLLLGNRLDFLKKLDRKLFGK